VDLLLLAGVSVTVMVGVLALVWLVPMLAVAAIAALADES